MAEKDAVIKTGFKQLDNLIELEAGGVALIAGRPKAGKTAMLGNLLNGILDNGRPVMLFNYEGRPRDVLLRLLIARAGVTLDTLRNFGCVREFAKIYKGNKLTDKDYQALAGAINAGGTGDDGQLKVDVKTREDVDCLAEAWHQLQDAFKADRLVINCKKPHVEDLCSIARHQPKDVVILIDYVQLIPPPASMPRAADNRTIELQRISNALKDLCLLYTSPSPRDS